MKNIIFKTAAVLLLLSLAACQTQGTKIESAPVSVQILHTNDHHSHLDGTSYDLTLDGTATRVQMGGFSRIVSLIQSLRTDNSIVLNSGELNGTMYFSLFKGEADFKVFNQLKLDAYALGNHEFDEGDARLAELIEMANFPVVSSNMTPLKASPLYSRRDKILPYIIKEIDGQQIAVIGVLKVEKTKNSSLVSDDVAFTPEMDTVRDQVSQLEDMGINKIILLSHVGYFNDVLFAQNISGIDVIVGGDTHSLLGDQADLSQVGLEQKYYGQTGPFDNTSHDSVQGEKLGEYPTTVLNPDGNPVHIVTAWEYAYGLGILDVDFDAEGIASRAEGQILIPVETPFLQKNADGERVEVSAEKAALIISAIEDSPILTMASPDPDTEAILQPYRDQIEAVRETKIGTVSETMGFERIPSPFGPGETPTGSYAAYVVSEAFLSTNHQIDIAIQNAGGVRTQFLQGDFKVGDAITALPFSNTIVMIQMTGAEVVQVLNEAAYYALNTGSTGAFPYGAAVRYDVDTRAGNGSVIFNVDVRDKNSGEWSSIDPETTYTVCTNSFTALGKDNYLTFKEVRTDESKFEDTHINYYIPLKEYIEELPGQILPPLDSENYTLKSVR